MRAWTVVKLVAGLAALGAIFLAGYLTGGSSVSSGIDQVQIRHLNSCLPISTTVELGQCMGIEIVQGQP